MFSCEEFSEHFLIGHMTLDLSCSFIHTNLLILLEAKYIYYLPPRGNILLSVTILVTGVSNLLSMCYQIVCIYDIHISKHISRFRYLSKIVNYAKQKFYTYICLHIFKLVINVSLKQPTFKHQSKSIFVMKIFITHLC